MSEDARTNRGLGWVLPASLVVGVFALWGLWLLYGVQIVHARLSTAVLAGAPTASARIAELGQVGDLFGGINALFAALAGAGVFWAGYLQHRTLVATQKARDDEKQRFAAQQLEEEARHNRQQFEATFFQLLALLRDLLQGLRLRHYNSDEEVMLVDWVISHTLNIAGGLHGYSGGGAPNVAVAWEDVRQRAQNFVFTKNLGQLSPLFRTAYELFDHIGHMEQVEPILAGKYADIAKAQLTDSLLVLFALYALVDSTKPYGDIIERFHLLETLAEHKYVRPVFALRYHYSAFDSSVAAPGV